MFFRKKSGDGMMTAIEAHKVSSDSIASMSDYMVAELSKAIYERASIGEFHCVCEFEIDANYIEPTIKKLTRLGYGVEPESSLVNNSRYRISW